MRRTPVVRARLIQSIVELQDVLRDPLHWILERYGHPAVTYEDVLTWILAEEIELIYLLFDNQHQVRRHRDPYCSIYQDLRQSFEHVTLSRYVSHYVAAPLIYSDNNSIDLRIEGPDLVLDYYRNPYEPPEIVSYPMIPK